MNKYSVLSFFYSSVYLSLCSRRPETGGLLSSLFSEPSSLTFLTNWKLL
jgi:hypothetical protein